MQPTGREVAKVLRSCRQNHKISVFDRMTADVQEKVVSTRVHVSERTSRPAVTLGQHRWQLLQQLLARL